jgi:hypothetical protein
MHVEKLHAEPAPAALDFWHDRQIGRLTAPLLDRIADAELQHGHVARAEQLARIAAELRGAP